MSLKKVWCVFIIVTFMVLGNLRVTEAKSLPQTRFGENVLSPTATVIGGGVEEVGGVEDDGEVKTPTVLINPYKGKVWNQYCERRWKEGTVLEVTCYESWAREPLPGGCPTVQLAYKGYSGCSAAAMSYVINLMLTPEEIMTATNGRVTGVTPDFLIDDVFPSLGYKMDCNGFSETIIKEGLSYFGLSTRSVPVSKYSLQGKILPGEMAIVGVKIRYKGSWMEHWSVPVSFLENRVTFADSFFGMGKTVIFDEVSEIYSWEIISDLLVSKLPSISE